MTKSPKNVKATEPVETGPTSQDLISAILKEHKDEHYNYHEKVSWRVSTGSLLLDTATGGVAPSLWRLTGNNNSGKTPQMLEIVRNILKDVPNSKAVWVLAEGRLSDENRERCGLTFVTDPKDWALGTILLLKANVFELFIRVVKDLVKNNPENIRYAFVVDSVDGLMLRDDAAKDITEANRVAGVPMLSKKMLQSLSLGMWEYGHWMGMISQVTSEIKLDPYAKSANRGGGFSGGNALLHASDVILEYAPSYGGDFILDGAGKFGDGKTKVIGQNVRVTLNKSVLEATKKLPIQYPIKYGRKPSGIWVEREIADLLLAYGLVSRGGSWITLHASLIADCKAEGLEVPEKVQGLDNLYGLLEKDAALTAFLFNKVKGLIGEMAS